MKSKSRLLVSITAIVALLLGLISMAFFMTAQAASGTSGGVYFPLVQTRVADTITGTNTTASPLAAGAVRSIKVTGIGGVPTADVGAVVLDVGALSSTGGLLYAYPDGGTRSSSFMTLPGGRVPDSNTVMVKPGTDGKVAIYNSAGSTDINVDVQGYFTATAGEASAGGFKPVNPTRVVSTSTGVGLPQAKLVGQQTYEAQIAGKAGIPTDATAVFANVRVLNANVNAGLKIGASTDAWTTAQAVDYQSGDDNDMGFSMKLGTDGKIKVTSDKTGASLDLIVDVQGYFSGTSDDGGTFTPLTNSRILDTRTTTALVAHSTRDIVVAGKAGVPDAGEVGAVAITIKAMDWTATGTMAVYDIELGTSNTASNLSFKAPYDEGITTTAVVSVSSSGTVRIRNNSSGPVHILLDAQGWFSRSHPVNVPVDNSDMLADGLLTPEAPQVSRRSYAGCGSGLRAA